MGNNKDKIKRQEWVKGNEWAKGQLILLCAVIFIFLFFRQDYLHIFASIVIFFLGGLYGHHVRRITQIKSEEGKEDES